MHAPTKINSHNDTDLCYIMHTQMVINNKNLLPLYNKM